jgi:hypothetical protein
MRAEERFRAITNVGGFIGTMARRVNSSSRKREVQR